MGILACSLLWVMQDIYHQPLFRVQSLRLPVQDLGMGLSQLQWWCGIS